MAKKKSRPPQSNGYDDDDMRQLLEEIEELEAEKVSIRAKAAGDCGAIAKKIAVKKGEAKEVGIPTAVLNGTLKTRKLERQIKAVSDAIPDDLAEVFEDAVGQFSFFAPEGEDPVEPGQTAAQRAAAQRKKEAQANQDAEQEEGEKVLEDLVN